jgi:hypothetical protein
VLERVAVETVSEAAANRCLLKETLLDRDRCGSNSGLRLCEF